MATSSDSKDYSSRMYLPGKSPLRNHNFNYGCHLTDLSKLREGLGDEVFNDVMNASVVGVILQLAVRGYTWSAHLIYQYKMWSIIEGQPLRFSLHEFADITQLNCDPIAEFRAVLGVSASESPNWYQLGYVLSRCQIWIGRKKRMVAKLFILHVGIFGLHRNSRVPLKCAKRVLDEEAFENSQWSRLAFKSLVESMRVASFDRDSYTLHGFVHAVLIWAYESVSILGEQFEKRVQNDQNPDTIPLLRWHSSRPRFNLENVMEQGKRNSDDNKVCSCKPFEVNPVEEIYPFWPDEDANPNVDKKLDNMILEILDGCLDESFWANCEPAIKLSKKEKRKKHVVM
ncbi:hypothetical protein EUTSA_v10003035mg, partial [Eutrema salsugineum]